MKNVPLGLPGQAGGLPTTSMDRGDDTQERFRYQWAMGIVLLADGFAIDPPATALWCEYHDDFLLELDDGTFVAVQVKTDSSENARWRLSAEALIAAVTRFCVLEKLHGARIGGYEFCSNAPPYVPAATTTKVASLASSPIRLLEACRAVGDFGSLVEPDKSAFVTLLTKSGVDADTLFGVLLKLRFRLGPSLRDYDAAITTEVISALPGCSDLTRISARRLRESLMGVIQTACRVPTEGIDGVLAYISSNGQPEVAIRGKCITLQSARAIINQLRKPDFQFVDCGLGLSADGSPGRASVLQRKMRNAYIGSQYEPLRWRMESAERRLMERAISHPDGFDAHATQVTASVLMVCKDAEAQAFRITDERQRGNHIYAQVLQELGTLADSKPHDVYHEPVSTLMGVAGMLSGECRFAWGVPLDEDDDGP